MKSIVVLFLFLQLSIAIQAVKESSEEELFDTKINDVIKVCKDKKCTKEQAMDQLKTLIDGIMKDVKPATIDLEEVRKEFESSIDELTKQGVFTKNELIDFFKSFEAKYQDKFIAKTTKKP